MDDKARITDHREKKWILTENDFFYIYGDNNLAIRYMCLKCISVYYHWYSSGYQFFLPHYALEFLYLPLRLTQSHLHFTVVLRPVEVMKWYTPHDGFGELRLCYARILDCQGNQLQMKEPKKAIFYIMYAVQLQITVIIVLAAEDPG